jgi:hypothetical protein
MGTSPRALPPCLDRNVYHSLTDPTRTRAHTLLFAALYTACTAPPLPASPRTAALVRARA